jgi:hypothetical protein
MMGKSSEARAVASVWSERGWRAPAAVFALVASVAISGCTIEWTYEFELTAPPPPGSVDPIGSVSAVAISGEWAAVARVGKVEIFRHNPLGYWDLSATVRPAPGAPLGRFGWAVAMHGDTLVVGAPEFGTGEIGYADVFVYTPLNTGSPWVRQVTLTPWVTSSNEVAFGGSVALQGDDLVVGAYRFDGGKGRAFVFRRQGGVWGQAQVLQPMVDVFDSGFGKIVHISGQTIAIAHPGPGQHNEFPGEVELFDFDGQTWNPGQVLVPSGGGVFADALLLDGDVLVAESSAGLQTFRRDNGLWTYSTTLPDVHGSRANVALAGSLLFVGDASRTVDGHSNAGAVDVYRMGGGYWLFSSTLTDPSATDGEGFGTTVEAASPSVIVGSGSPTAGLVSVFRADRQF